jgi:hypothetical protein
MGETNETSRGDPASQAAGLGQQRVGETGPGPDQTAAPSGPGRSGPGSGDAASDATPESERAQARGRQDGGVEDEEREAAGSAA